MELADDKILYSYGLSLTYFIKTHFLILFFSKGRDGPWLSFIPSDTLEPNFLREEVLYFRSFAETKCLP